MMDFFLYAILISLFYIYSGIGLSFLLCPKDFEKYCLYFSPFVGLAYLSYFSWFFFEYSAWGTSQYTWILIPPLFFLLLAYIIKKDRFATILYPVKKENLALIVLCIIIFFAISFPYYSRIDGISNTITLGNNDVVSYATISKYLTHSSNSYSSIKFDPNVTPGFLMLLENTYFPAFLSTALPSSFFGLDPYQIQNLVIYLFFIFILPIVFLIGIEIFGYNQKIALGVTFLVGASFHLLYIIYQGFLGQIIGIGFFLCLFLVTYYAILKFNKIQEFFPYLLLNIVFCFGLLTSYSILLPLFFIPSILFIISYFIQIRSKMFLFLSTIYLSLTLFFTFLISPFSFINRMNSLILFNNAIAGWDMPILSPDWIFGLVGTNISMHSIPILSTLVISLPIVVLVLLSLYHLYKKELQLFYISGSYLGFTIIFYSYLITQDFFSPTFTGESYKAYKLVTYFIPLILLIGLYFFKDLDLNITKMNLKKKIVIVSFLTLLIIGNLGSMASMISFSTNQSTMINENIIDIHKLNTDENITSINVIEKSYWDQMWIYYFLFENKTVFLKYRTYYADSPQNGEWTLLKESGEDIFYLQNFQELNNTIILNKEYYLEKKPSLEFSFNNGWYDLESNNDKKWRWTGQSNITPSLELNLMADQSINMFLHYSSLNEANALTVLLDNETIKECNDNNYCFIENLNLTKGKHILVFSTKLPPELSGNGDPRYFSYSFSNVTIIKNS
jgi:hypothetical protein